MVLLPRAGGELREVSHPNRFIRVRNHDDFQHYRDRTPPWIKWQFSCLQSYNFTRLTDTQKWHAVGIAMLASRMSNHVPADTRWIAREIAATYRVDLRPLLAARFVEFCECQECRKQQGNSATDASKVLRQDASEVLFLEDKKREEKRPPPTPSGRGVGGNGEDDSGMPTPGGTESAPEVSRSRRFLEALRSGLVE